MSLLTTIKSLLRIPVKIIVWIFSDSDPIPNSKLSISGMNKEARRELIDDLISSLKSHEHDIDYHEKKILLLHRKSSSNKNGY